MKKFLACFAFFAALVFVIGCGGGSKTSGESVSNFGKLGQECYPNRTCDEGLLCDEEKNICIEDPENPINDENGNRNDENNPIENNDDDKPIEHNDQNNPIENEDKDTPVIDNDNLVNDDDIIDNNDNDGEPIEINDNDIQSDECASKDIIISAEKITNYSQEEIQEKINYYHDMNRSQCYGSFIEKEKFDTQGNLCVEDECNIEPNDIAQGENPLWIDNLLFLFRETSSDGLPPPSDIVYYKKIEKLNQGSPTDFKTKQRRITFYAKGIPTASCFQPNNIVEDASTITMSIGDGYYNGCYFGDQQVSPSDIISTKNIQPKMLESDFIKACEKVPNSGYYQPDKKCSTTITEFAWLENVVQYLYNKSGLTWRNITIQNTKIEKDVDNIFRMYFSVGGQYSWAVELPNAKRCLDECYGIDGCEVSINPSADISNGCKVKEPDND